MPTRLVLIAMAEYLDQSAGANRLTDRLTPHKLMSYANALQRAVSEPIQDQNMRYVASGPMSCRHRVAKNPRYTSGSRP